MLCPRPSAYEDEGDFVVKEKDQVVAGCTRKQTFLVVVVFAVSVVAVKQSSPERINWEEKRRQRKEMWRFYGSMSTWCVSQVSQL